MGSKKPVRYVTEHDHIVEVHWVLEQGWQWRRRSANGRAVAQSPSGETYSRKDAALRAAVRANPPKPRIR